MAPRRMDTCWVIFGWVSASVNDASVAAVTKRGFCCVVETKLEWVQGGGEGEKGKTAWHDPCHVLLTVLIHCLIK